MDWKANYELGHPAMDETHREYVVLVTELARAEGQDELACFDRLIEHTQAHFDQENRWMEECAFPPIHCHEGEHTRVLASLREIRESIAKGARGTGRVAAGELEAWFANHAATMDAALAWHMRNVGYTPEALTAEAVAA